MAQGIASWLYYEVKEEMDEFIEEHKDDDDFELETKLDEYIEDTYNTDFIKVYSFNTIQTLTAFEYNRILLYIQEYQEEKFGISMRIDEIDKMLTMFCWICAQEIRETYSK